MFEKIIYDISFYCCISMVFSLVDKSIPPKNYQLFTLLTYYDCISRFRQKAESKIRQFEWTSKIYYHGRRNCAGTKVPNKVGPIKLYKGRRQLDLIHDFKNSNEIIVI